MAREKKPLNQFQLLHCTLNVDYNERYIKYKGKNRLKIKDCLFSLLVC